uniref:Nuclease HARBI1 n=1 Tax=Ditylenchus dipsaci TaxID=166011 RepID=A0A915D887_9BILA
MAAFMQIRVPRRIERQEAWNPVDELGDDELVRRYRFDREGIRYIASLVDGHLQGDVRNGGKIPTEVQVCIAFKYIASNTFQLHIARAFRVAQNSVSMAIKRVTNALASRANEFIYMSSTVEEYQRNARAFQSIAEFPRVVGLIDGTHVHIVSPPQEIEMDYVNRKNRHSINVQVQ